MYQLVAAFIFSIVSCFSQHIDATISTHSYASSNVEVFTTDSHKNTQLSSPTNSEQGSNCFTAIEIEEEDSSERKKLAKVYWVLISHLQTNFNLRSLVSEVSLNFVQSGLDKTTCLSTQVFLGVFRI